MKDPNQPLISAIVAMAENRVIGKNNQLPWHLPADLKHFKAITTGNPILMGRKTHESIGRPLPNRTNIVITRNKAYQAAGCVVVTTLHEAIQCAVQHQAQEIFIIGGADVYRQLLPQVQRIYMTIVHQAILGDTYFPELAQDTWREISRETHAADDENEYAYSFLVLENV